MVIDLRSWVNMDNTKDKPPKLITVTVDSLVTILSRAKELEKYQGQGVFDATACIVPPYLEDLADIGDWLLSQMRCLPNEHPTKTKYDWKKVEQGVEAIKKGKVAVVVNPYLDTTVSEGLYQLKIVDY